MARLEELVAVLMSFIDIAVANNCMIGVATSIVGGRMIAQTRLVLTGFRKVSNGH